MFTTILIGGITRLKNKIVASALTASLVIGMMASTGFADTTATGFSDIGKSYAKDAILDLQAKGILSGTSGAFNPKGTMSRVEYVVMLVKSLGLEVNADSTSSFKDVKGWAIPYVEAALKAGIITGNGDGTFAPNVVLTREMSVVMLVRSLQSQGKLDGEATLTFKDANDISGWARQATAIAFKYGLIAGTPDGKFNPKGVTNREMGATMGSNLLNAIDTIVKPVTPPTVTPPVVVPPITTPVVTPPASSGGGGGYIPPVDSPVVTLSSISVNTSEAKTEYIVGEELDTAGLVVTGTYSNGTTAIIAVTASDVTGFNSEESLESQVLTITVGGKSTTYNVAIVAKVVEEVILSSIAITSPATKTSYLVGETLDITGLVTTSTYSDNSTKVEILTLDNVTGFDSSVAVESQTLTITVGGKTATYNVEIVAPVVVKTSLETAITTEIGSDRTAKAYILDSTDYTEATWDAYSLAIDSAIVVEENVYATQPEVDLSVESIAIAKDSLALTTLKKAENAKNKFVNAYDAGSLDWDTLITAMYYLGEATKENANVDTLKSYYASLESLDMSDKDSSKYAISTGALVNFTGLTDLNLSNTGISELGGLVELTKLIALNISGTEVTELNVLWVNEETFKDLTSLNAEGILTLESIAGLVEVANSTGFDATSLTWNLEGSKLASDPDNHIGQIEAKFIGGTFTAPTIIAQP
jgi:hypothetical protein